MYCGRKGRLTKDHIPPRGLFSKPPPKNLITVPSCSQCNSGASKDDEYFRTVLALKERAGDDFNARGIRDSVLRSLSRPRGRRFGGLFLSQVGYINPRTTSGIHLAKRLAYNVDLERLDRVAVRVVKGLHYILTGKRIPTGFQVVAFCEDGLRDLSETDREELRRTVVVPVLEGKYGAVGDDAMKYWVSFDPTGDFISAWILEFYSDVRFLVLVLADGDCSNPETCH